MKKEIGKRLESIRKEKGMTKEQFAKLIGVSGQYLGTVERGVNGLTIGKVKRICEETGVSADYLLFGQEQTAERKERNSASLLADFSVEQIQIAFDVIKKVAVFLKSENANELLIKDIFKSEIKIIK